jgi:hypothetical protein
MELMRFVARGPAVSRNEAEVDALCRRSRQELEGLAWDHEGRLAPLRERRSALRRAFRAGELTQQDYQRRLKALSSDRDRLECEYRDATRFVCERFVVWMQGHCGRQVSLNEAETMLAEVAFVVEDTIIR